LFCLRSEGEILKAGHSNIGAYVKALILTKGLKSKEVANETGIRPQRLSEFLSGRTQVGVDVLVSVLDCLGIDLKSIIDTEIRKTTGSIKNENHISSDIYKTIEALPPLEQKTLLSTLLRKAKVSASSEIEECISNIQTHRDRITFKRRGAC
jgi:transcriptional regulator with XRE-family HTH domain